MTIETPKTLCDGRPGRSLSKALLARTFVITLALGVLAASATMWVDLQREKNAVGNLAQDFMSSASPTAAAAVYNFDQAAAEQVAEGLFLERAITGIKIVNEGDVMVDENRHVPPTLPPLGTIAKKDEIVLTKLLYAPGADGDAAPIGELSITVDRSLVAPEIVDRLLTFFLVTTAKNVLFGLCLYWAIFSVLARHISELTRVTRTWQPGADAVDIPSMPSILRDTEVDALGHRIKQVTGLASRALEVVRQSHDAVVDSNLELSDRVRDRTRELERVNSRLEYMADRDGLTGLFNRAYFDRFIEGAFAEAIKNNEPIAILMIDVDHFKAFNDFYGHQAGDAAIRRVAAILNGVQEETGCLVARYGGEEFVALLQSRKSSPDQLAQSIHTTLEKVGIEHLHSTVARYVTVSIGTASTEKENGFKSPYMLISAADDALYEAKKLGRNQTVASTPEIRARTNEQRMSVQNLLEAIEAEEFEPYLQPQVDARTGELLGAEALVRWVKSDGTIVPPAQFMETAEKTGLIKQIDALMLEKLNSFLTGNPQLMPNLSFNVTGDSFSDDHYVERILALVEAAETGITVELLETAFIDRPGEFFLWQLDTMKEAGVKVEIDDFGTGRTSILGLMAISPSRLKIARELILPLSYRSEQKQLVTSVVEIAKSLEMDVLAEGVETQEVAQMLIDLDCWAQQGYFHAKPMPLHEFADAYGSHPQAQNQLG